MIQITPHLSLNASAIVSVEIDQRFYANGSSVFLIITMLDGKQHRIEHGYGIDVFAIERRIKEALG